MDGPKLTAVTLSAFKSFQQQRFDLQPLSVVIGRNSSGKSNLFDALDVLRRLVVQPVLSEALDSRHPELRPVRGGSRGLAPFDSSSFTIGCEVASAGSTLHYEIEVSVAGQPHITRESLRCQNGKAQNRMFSAAKTEPSQLDISVAIPNGKPGPDPTYQCRDSASVLSQVASLLHQDNTTHQTIRRAVSSIQIAVRCIFGLDPIPHLMRGYVNERDNDLRQHGENISAAIASLRTHNPHAFSQLVDVVNTVADGNVVDLKVAKSEPLNDVMVSLVEDYTSRPGVSLTPASQMSDGLLRFLAIAVAMLQHHGDDDRPVASTPRIFVIEEIENGLHPSQAKLVLELIQQSTTSNPGNSVIVSTHSPALLTACEGQLLQNVVVSSRSTETGLSTLERLVDAPGYAAAMAQGTAGDIMTHQRLNAQPELNVESFLANLGEQ